MGLTVKKKDVAELLTALGLETAGDWPVKKLQEKVASVPRMAEERAEQLEAAEPKIRGIAEEIVETLNNGEEVIVEDNKEKKEEGKVKTKVKVKKSKDNQPEEKEVKKVKKVKKDEAAKPEKVKVKKVEKAEKKAKKEKTNFAEKPGVISHMIGLLKQASKKNPITRDEIVKSLVDEFPDREEKGMRVTVVSQLPTRLRRRPGLDVFDNGKGGYWAKKIKPEVAEAE